MSSTDSEPQVPILWQSLLGEPELDVTLGLKTVEESDFCSVIFSVFRSVFLSRCRFPLTKLHPKMRWRIKSVGFLEEGSLTDLKRDPMKMTAEIETENNFCLAMQNPLPCSPKNKRLHIFTCGLHNIFWREQVRNLCPLWLLVSIHIPPSKSKGAFLTSLPGCPRPWGGAQLPTHWSPRSDLNLFPIIFYLQWKLGSQWDWQAKEPHQTGDPVSEAMGACIWG